MYARVLASGQPVRPSCFAATMTADSSSFTLRGLTRSRSRRHFGHWPRRGHCTGRGRCRCDRPRQNVDAGGGRPGQRPAVARRPISGPDGRPGRPGRRRPAGGTSLGRLERPGCLAPDRRGRYIDRPERAALVRCQARSPLVGRRGGDDSPLPRGRPQDESPGPWRRS